MLDVRNKKLLCECVNCKCGHDEMPTPVSYSSMIRNQIAFDVLEVNTKFIISKEMEDDINTLTEYLGTLPDTPLDTYLKQNPNKEIVTINDDGEWMEVFLKDKK